MKTELKTKIADILAKHYPLPVITMKDVCNQDAWCDNTAKEIVKLIKPKKQKK